MTADRFPLPMPYGWYQVAYSDELDDASVKPLHYFGRDLVAVRTASGAVSVYDAFCPHLGAHLGYGGRVDGETLSCPFHGWCFDRTGACIEVPYAKRIPPAAKLRPYPTVEKNGTVLVWYHPAGKEPGWEVPDVPEYGDPAWTPYERREWTVRSHNQELAENTVDQAHFRYLHGTNTVASTDVRADGPLLHVVSKSKMGTAQGEADGTIDIRTFGFGLGLTRFTGIVETLVVTSGTPVDAERVHMRLAFTLRKLPDSDATKGVGQAFVAEVERQFEQDIPIWENKIHLDRPVLCDGDGPIGALRAWAKQFYDFDGPVARH